MLRRAIAAAVLLSFAGTGALLSGCATYASRTAEVRRALELGDLEKALGESGKSLPRSSRVLGLLEKGLLLHYAERWEESNRVFEEAEAEIEDLYTRSLTREAAALLTSDNLLPFHGERFERVFIHYYRALNYIRLGGREDALVECRKVSGKLQAYRDAEGGDEGYPDDAFLRYLSGILYEWGGETNDAWIAYRAADGDYARYAERYGVTAPSALDADLLRTSEALGFQEEFDRRRAACPDLPDGAWRRGRDEGEIIVLHEAGYVPRKIELSLSLPILERDEWEDREAFAPVLAGRRHGWSPDGAEVKYWLRIALPAYPPADPPPARSRVRVDGGREVASETAEDLGAIARASFEAREGGILARTIVRALAKYGLHRAVAGEDEDEGAKRKKTKKGEREDAGGGRRQLFGLLANLFGAATESADTRSWLLLPREIAVARIPVAAGTHEVQVLTYDRSGGRLEARTFEGVKVRPGGMAFVHLRTFR